MPPSGPCGNHNIYPHIKADRLFSHKLPGQPVHRKICVLSDRLILMVQKLSYRISSIAPLNKIGFRLSCPYGVSKKLLDNPGEHSTHLHVLSTPTYDFPTSATLHHGCECSDLAEVTIKTSTLKKSRLDELSPMTTSYTYLRPNRFDDDLLITVLCCHALPSSQDTTSAIREGLNRSPFIRPKSSHVLCVVLCSYSA